VERQHINDRKKHGRNLWPQAYSLRENNPESHCLQEGRMRELLKKTNNPLSCLELATYYNKNRISDKQFFIFLRPGQKNGRLSIT
jgi:hypothetical protein